MSAPRTCPLSALTGVFSLLLLPLASGFGQTSAATAPVGFLQTQCLANSDTLVALPFTRPAAFTGTLASVSGTGSNVISFSSAPNFVAGQFVYAPTATTPVTDHFYLIVGPASTALTGTLSVTQTSASVVGTGTAFTAQVAAGDRLTINDGYNLLTYTVASVDSDNGLTLDRPFVDSAAGGTSMSSALVSSARTAPAVTTAKPSKPSKTAKPAWFTAVTKPVKAATMPGNVITKPVVQSTGGTLGGLSATFDHSPYEGRWYMVTGNDASTVTVNLNGDSLSSVASGTQVSIIPYWTLGTVFPAADASVSFTPTTDLHSLNTQILIPDYSSTGTDLSAGAIYYFSNVDTNTGWRLFGDASTTDHGNDVILPDGYFIVSNVNAAVTLPVTFRGSVPVNKLVTNIASNTTQAQDNPLGLNRPVGVTLANLGLSPSNGTFAATTDTHNITDELFLYDNTSASYSKSASSIYFYYNGDWRLFGDAISNSHGADVIPAASAITVRRAATTSAATAAWSNAPNY